MNSAGQMDPTVRYSGAGVYSYIAIDDVNFTYIQPYTHLSIRQPSRSPPRTNGVRRVASKALSRSANDVVMCVFPLHRPRF
jgi:hypothetical protein